MVRFLSYLQGFLGLQGLFEFRVVDDNPSRYSQTENNRETYNVTEVASVTQDVSGFSSSGRLDMISRLDIRNPDFYSVFNDSELQRYFTPPPPRVPIYIWDNPEPFAKMIKDCLADRPIGKRFQFDNEYFLYESLLTSRHRVMNKEEAVFHYVPFVMRDCADQYRSKVQSIVYASPEYQRYRGANFIMMWNHWIMRGRLKEQSDAIHQDSSLIGEASTLPYSLCVEQTNSPDFCSCHVTDSPTPHARPLLFTSENEFMDRPWPPYDTSLYGNLSDIYQTRHFNFIFVGKMDRRPAYTDRVENTKACSKYGEPSIYIQTICNQNDPTKKISTWFKYPNCTIPLDETSNKSIVCLHNAWPPQFEFDKLLTNSKFGWHHTGDFPYSSRLSDLFNTLTLPVVTIPLMYGSSTPYQCTIPYQDLSFYVPPNKFPQCGEVVDELMNVPPLEVEKKLRLLYYYRPYHINSELSWDALLRETVTGCLSSSMVAEFNISMTDFTCNLFNKFKTQRMPKYTEADETPVFQLV